MLTTWMLMSLAFPLAGAGLIWALAPAGRDYARWTALFTALATLALAGWVVVQYPGDGLHAAIDLAWLGGPDAGIDVRFSLGLDGLSLWLYGLSALLMVTAVLVSWEAIQEGAAGFYALLLVLETGMLGVFAARDLILFYVFFEFTLIPLFFLIGVWGSEERRRAANKFFLFTLAGSVLTFLGLLTIVGWNYTQTAELTFSIPALTEGLHLAPLPASLQCWLFLALFAGFAIKVPLFPLHTWLPLAHVQAPTAGSVLLAGVLLKIGTYGFARFCLPWLPHAVAAWAPWLLTLSTAGIVYGALVALAQADIKRLIAYSSVSHLGYCMLGLFALNAAGLEGSVLQMINHGLSTGGLFALVGMLYERYHTREIQALGGVAARTPILACFMLLFTFSSIGLPGLNGFAGEFLILVGMFQRAWAETGGAWRATYQAFAVLAVLGVVLGAWYMLWLVQRVFFGRLREPHGHRGDGHGDHEHGAVSDLSPREIAALVPLAVFVVWIGLFPQTWLRPIGPAVERLSADAVYELERTQDPSLAPTELALQGAIPRVD